VALPTTLTWLIRPLRGVALRFMEDLGCTPQRRASIAPRSAVLLEAAP